MKNHRVVTWQEVENYIEFLINKLPEGIVGIYGIPRGGNVIATILSYRLDLPLLQAPIEGCLVVDDISDTGKTLVHYKEKGYLIATMFIHKDTCVMPDYWFLEKNDHWIQFPWEEKCSE